MNISNLISQVRSSSREMVRELGLLNNRFTAIGSPSLCHALVEIDTHKVLNSAQLSHILNLEKSTISRLVTQLHDLSLCKIDPDCNDKRNKLISLTDKGQTLANEIHSKARLQVEEALNMLSEEEKNTVAKGLSLYANALRRSNIQNACIIRKLTERDVFQLSQVIKSVRAEFGFDANHPEFSLFEEELKNLYACYTEKDTEYYVLIFDEKIVGGAGFGLISTPDKKICELKGMYLSKHLRGLGLGSQLLKKIASEANKRGFKKCYLETNDFMHGANTLYVKNGFRKLNQPLEGAGHKCTNIWYIKEL